MQIYLQIIPTFEARHFPHRIRTSGDHNYHQLRSQIQKDKKKVQKELQEVYIIELKETELLKEQEYTDSLLVLETQKETRVTLFARQPEANKRQKR